MLMDFMCIVSEGAHLLVDSRLGFPEGSGIDGDGFRTALG